MVAVATCSAHAKLAEGTDPLGGGEASQAVGFVSRSLHSGGSVPPPHPFPGSSCSAITPSIVEPGCDLADPWAATFCPGPHGACRLALSPRLCFPLAWEQGCVAEPTGCPATCIPMGLWLPLQPGPSLCAAVVAVWEP